MDVVYCKGDGQKFGMMQAKRYFVQIFLLVTAYFVKGVGSLNNGFRWNERVLFS